MFDFARDSTSFSCFDLCLCQISVCISTIFFSVLRSWLLTLLLSHFKCLNIWIPEFARYQAEYFYLFSGMNRCVLLWRGSHSKSKMHTNDNERAKKKTYATLLVVYVMTMVVRVQCNMKHGSAYHNKSKSNKWERDAKCTSALNSIRYSTAERVYSKWLRLSLPHDRKCFHFDYKLYFIIKIISAQEATSHVCTTTNRHDAVVWALKHSVGYVHQKYNTIAFCMRLSPIPHGSPHPKHRVWTMNDNEF